MLCDLSQRPVDLEVWPLLEGLLAQGTLANLREEVKDGKRGEEEMIKKEVKKKINIEERQWKG